MNIITKVSASTDVAIIPPDLSALPIFGGVVGFCILNMLIEDERLGSSRNHPYRRYSGAHCQKHLKCAKSQPQAMRFNGELKTVYGY